MNSSWNRRLDKYKATLGAIVMMKPEITYNTNRVTKTGKKAPDGIEIRFGDVRPTEAVRTLLKEHGFQFSDKQKIWYAIDKEKSRSLAQRLEAEEIEADDTKYEKLNFWAKVKGLAFYNKLSNYTEFWVREEPSKFFYSKKLLQRAYPNVENLIREDKLSFKKFYNKVIGEETTNEDREDSTNEDEQSEGEDNNLPTSKTSKEDYREIGQKIRFAAEAMQKLIDSKINSATSMQKPTAKRLRVAKAMRDEGYRLWDIQSYLFVISEAFYQNRIDSYPLLKKIRTRTHVENLIQYNQMISAGHSVETIKQIFDKKTSSLSPLNINSFKDWQDANQQLSELLSELPNYRPKKETEEQRKIKDLEREVFSKKIDGFFPTPIELVSRLIQMADLMIEHKILEPSAGKGDIADGIREHFNGQEVNISLCEVNYSLREILTLKGYEIVEYDFLNLKDKYDRIVMNPPFENGKDIDHVMHAFSLLKKGGRLVSIMGEGAFFRTFKKDKEFREFLNEKNAFVSEPIKDAFKNGFKSTGINVRIVGINQDGSVFDPNQKTDTGLSEVEKLELEALAQIELLKIQVELSKNKKNGLKGIKTLDPIKLEKYRRLITDYQSKWEVLNFK